MGPQSSNIFIAADYTNRRYFRRKKAATPPQKKQKTNNFLFYRLLLVSIFFNTVFDGICMSKKPISSDHL